MSVVNTSAPPGKTEHAIPINGKWADDIAGYSTALYYDSNLLEIVEVSLKDTVAGYPDPNNWTVYWGYNDTAVPSYVTATAVTFGYDFIEASEGILFNVIVNISSTAPEGDTDIDLANDVGPTQIDCLFVDPLGTTIDPDELIDGVLTIDLICGDANGDRNINSADVVYLINYLFQGGPEPNPICIGDATGDGSVNSADIVKLINYLFQGDVAPFGCCQP
jgi:hypothetical protein